MSRASLRGTLKACESNRSTLGRSAAKRGPTVEGAAGDTEDPAAPSTSHLNHGSSITLSSAKVNCSSERPHPDPTLPDTSTLRWLAGVSAGCDRVAPAAAGPITASLDTPATNACALPGACACSRKPTMAAMLG
eukprot:1192981-Prorocentrum_minimum.AAC.3